MGPLTATHSETVSHSSSCLHIKRSESRSCYSRALFDLVCDVILKGSFTRYRSCDIFIFTSGQSQWSIENENRDREKRAVIKHGTRDVVGSSRVVCVASGCGPCGIIPSASAYCRSTRDRTHSSHDSSQYRQYKSRGAAASSGRRVGHQLPAAAVWDSDNADSQRGLPCSSLASRTGHLGICGRALLCACD